LPIDNAQHGGNEADSEDIVGIGEETNTRYDDGSNVIPTKGSFVDLRESKSAALIGICDSSARPMWRELAKIHTGNVGVVIVEVVEGRIATSCALRHAEGKTAMTRCFG
jgi:hypothetical protein